MIQKLNGIMINKFSRKADFEVKKSVKDTDSVIISQQAKKMSKKTVENTARQEKITNAKLNLQDYSSGETLAHHVAEKIAEKLYKIL